MDKVMHSLTFLRVASGMHENGYLSRGAILEILREAGVVVAIDQELVCKDSGLVQGSGTSNDHYKKLVFREQVYFRKLLSSISSILSGSMVKSLSKAIAIWNSLLLFEEALTRTIRPLIICSASSTVICREMLDPGNKYSRPSINAPLLEMLISLVLGPPTWAIFFRAGTAVALKRVALLRISVFSHFTPCSICGVVQRIIQS